MDALLLPSRSTSSLVSRQKVCSSSREGELDRVLLRNSWTHAQTNLRTSFKLENQRNWRSGKGSVNGVVKATLSSELEVGEAFPTESKSEAIARSVALLKTAAKTRKVSGKEIWSAFRVLEKGNVDPADFPAIVGGTRSAGRSWMLVAISSKDEYYAEGGAKYYPITSVQCFDPEASTIDNGVFFGPFGELTLTGNYQWQGRKFTFNHHTMNLKIGSLGPFHLSFASKDKELTKTNPFFIWYYADDEIIVARGRGGGTAFWVRCTNVQKSIT